MYHSTFPRVLCLLLCTALCLTLALSGCDKEEPTSSTESGPVQLELACWATSAQYSRLVERFNASQSDYEVVLRDYWVEMGLNNPSLQELETARTRMHLQLATGERPDMIAYCGGFNIMSLIYSGIMMDLNPLMDSDPTFHRDAFHPTLFELTEVNGGLYELPVFYELEGLYVPRSVVGDVVAWTIEDYLAMEEALGEPLLKETAEDLLVYYTCFGLSNYIDVSTGTCSLDNPSFQKLLAFMKSVEDKLADYPEETQTPAYLWRISGVKDRSNWLDDWDWRYGETPMLVGYPQDNAAGPAASAMQYSFGICADTEYVDGCWAFLKFLLSEEVQAERDSAGFPVRTSVLDDQLTRSMLPADDPDSLFYQTHRTDGSDDLREPLTQADVDTLYQLIYGISTVKMAYYDIETILTEETAPYFAGDRTVEETCRMMQERVSLFLSEQHQGLPVTTTPQAPQDAADEPLLADREPLYPDAGYTIEDGAVVVGDRRFALDTTDLMLEDNAPGDYRFLAELTQLEFLSLSGTAATIDLTPLAQLPALATVDISAADCVNSDLSPLADCPALRTLTLEFIKSGLDAVGEITQLTFLGITLTSFDDLSFVLNLTNLESLVIVGRNVADIAPLIDHPLPNLTTLQCAVYPGQEEALRAAYPDCDITVHERERPVREPLYPDAGYTIEDGAVVVDGFRYPLGITMLTLSEACDDSRFLAEFTYLYQLTLEGDAATIDLSPLAELTELSTLTISAGGREGLDLSPLADCPALETLTLQSVHGPLDALGEVTQLTELSLMYCAFDDLSFIQSLTALERFHMVGSRSADIEPLIDAALPALTELTCTAYEHQRQALKFTYPDCDITLHLRDGE